MLTAASGMMPAVRSKLDRFMGVQRQGGFSLLELMAVILVIGLSLGMVGLSVSGGGPRDDIWDNIEKLMGMSQFAQEHAILSGNTVGLRVEPPEWQVARGDSIDEYGWRFQWVVELETGWAPLPNLPVLSLPPSSRLEVLVDEQAWNYKAQLDRTIPLAAFYSSGDMTDFALEFSDEREPGFTQNIKVDENGELIWVEAPEPPEVDENGF